MRAALANYASLSKICPYEKEELSSMLWNIFCQTIAGDG
jgi:hypothetical protein